MRLPRERGILANAPVSLLHRDRKPTLPQDEYHLILTLRLPPKSRCAETRPWISLACNIADVLTQKQKLVPDVQVNKLVSCHNEGDRGLDTDC